MFPDFTWPRFNYYRDGGTIVDRLDAVQRYILWISEWCLETVRGFQWLIRLGIVGMQLLIVYCDAFWDFTLIEQYGRFNKIEQCKLLLPIDRSVRLNWTFKEFDGVSTFVQCCCSRVKTHLEHWNVLFQLRQFIVCKQGFLFCARTLFLCSIRIS